MCEAGGKSARIDTAHGCRFSPGSPLRVQGRCRLLRARRRRFRLISCSRVWPSRLEVGDLSPEGGRCGMLKDACAKCRRPAEFAQSMTVASRRWHQECFTCSVCNRRCGRDALKKTLIAALGSQCRGHVRRIEACLPLLGCCVVSCHAYRMTARMHFGGMNLTATAHA
eukprot:358053-Chlamydomonas_euryale.AAC.5